MLNFQDTTKTKYLCEKRAIFLSKINGDKIKFTIKEESLLKYYGKTKFSHCCYSFVRSSHVGSNKNKRIR